MLPDKSKDLYSSDLKAKSFHYVIYLFYYLSVLASSCTVPETNPLENFLEEMKNFYAPVSKLSLFTTDCKSF